MSSIVITLRVNTYDVARGIDIFSQYKAKPKTLSNIIKAIYLQGIDRSVLPSNESLDYLKELTSQNKLQSDLPSDISMEPTNNYNPILLNHLNPEDRRTGEKILKYLSQVNDENILYENLEEEENDIARITAQLIFPIKDKFKKPNLIENAYNKYNQCSHSEHSLES